MNNVSPIRVSIGERSFEDVPSLVNYYRSSEFEETYTYYGQDLGCTCREESTLWKLWSPAATEAELRLYTVGSAAEATPYVEGVEKPYLIRPMLRKEQGVFELTLTGDYHGIYYIYRLKIGDEWVETADPYAKAAGVNGRRSMAVNLRRTDPLGWRKDS